MTKKPKTERSLFRKITNGILTFLSFILVIFIILFAYTQTSSFRSFLNNKTTEIVNNSIKGNISIGKIDGSIFSSFILRDVKLFRNNDTLFVSKKIELNFSPIQLFLNKIFIRNLLIEDTEFRLAKTQDSLSYFDYILAGQTKDSTSVNENSENKENSSFFPFVFVLHNFVIKNSRLIMKDGVYKNTNNFYPDINFGDLSLNNVNLEAEAAANINSSDFFINIKHFGFTPNSYNFNLQNLSGKFRINQKFAKVEELIFQSDSSSFYLDARMDSLNLFAPINLENFKNYPIFVDIHAEKFNFIDLSSFIPPTNILKGNPSFTMNARGTFGDINIDQLIMNYNQTHINFNGKVQKLNTPEKLFINGKFTNSEIHYDDVNKLLPTLPIPVYKNVILKDVNLTYKGEPLDFEAKIAAEYNKGMVDIDAKMDLNVEPSIYDIKINSKKLDLYNIIGIRSDLNGDFHAIGKGFVPEELNSYFSFASSKSKFDVFSIDTLNFRTNAVAKVLDLNVYSEFNSSKGFINGSLDLTNKFNPKYNLVGYLKKLNIAEFTNDSTNISDLNFNFDAEGENLEIDSLIGRFDISLDESSYMGVDLEKSELSLEAKLGENFRELKLKSDFIDFNIFGNFSANKAISLLSYQTNTVSQLITNQLSNSNASAILNSDGNQNIRDSLQFDEITNENIDFNFDYKFKDFQLFSKIFNIDKFNFFGDGSGTVHNDSSNFSIKANTNIDYFYHVTNQQLSGLSNTDLVLNFSRDNTVLKFENLLGALTINSEKVYAREEIDDVYCGLVFNNKNVFYDISATYDNQLTVESDGKIGLASGIENITLERLMIDYKDLEWENDEDISLKFTNEIASLSNFNLLNQKSSVFGQAELGKNGKQKADFNFENIKGSDLLSYITSIKSNDFYSNVNSRFTSRGTLDNPIINFRINADSVSFGEITFGNFIGRLTYTDSTFYPDFLFLNAEKDVESPILSFNGEIPKSMSLIDGISEVGENRDVELLLTARDFNLATFGNYLPFIKDQKGNLDLNLNLTGKFNNPEFSGYLNVSDFNFTSRTNNVKYKLGLSSHILGESITLDSLVVHSPNPKGEQSKLVGEGNIILDKYSVKDINLNLNGNLAVLSENSKIVSPDLYGDVIIETDGPWKFNYKEGSAKLTGNVKLDNTSLTFATAQSTFKSNTEIKYEFLIDSTKFTKNELLFNDLLSFVNKDSTSENTLSLLFDYDIGIQFGNDVLLTFLFSPIWNQKLVVRPTGEIFLKSEDKISSAQGVLELLDGSKFEYFASLNATGKVRFEGDITNPYLDIIATYNSDWLDTQDAIQPVEVRLKLQSNLSNLGKQLAGDQSNFNIYVGRRNIDDNVASTKYGDSDAISFIIFGKFKDELSSSDKKSLAQQAAISNTATALLGSVLTSFVNSAVGDVVNNIQLNQTGVNTRFKVSGKIQNIRYSIGGSQEVFQDINKAEIKVEWLLSPNFILRLERKDPVVQSSGTDFKISEFGIKYKIQF